MLAAALPRGPQPRRIDPALVTCDDTNLWHGARVIEANGGVFEDQRGPKLRYWVPTSPPRSTQHRLSRYGTCLSA